MPAKVWAETYFRLSQIHLQFNTIGRGPPANASQTTEGQKSGSAHWRPVVSE